MNFAISILCLLLPLTLMAAKPASVKPPKKDEIKNYFKEINEKVKGHETTEADQLLPEEKAELSESEIPLAFKKEVAKSKGSVSPFQRMIFSLVVLLIFSFGILIWIQRRGKKGSMASGARNIKILSQKSIGPKKELMIIRIAGETILLGVTEQNINPIKSLSLLDDEVPEFVEEKEFSTELVDKITTNFHNPQPDSGSRVHGYEVSRLSDVKDIVTKRYSQL